MKKIRFLALALALLLVMQALPAALAEEGEVVDLTILVIGSGVAFNDYNDNHVRDQMAKDIGVRITVDGVDDEKWNLLLAGNDLPDIVRGPTKSYEQLILGNNVIPMDDLLVEHGKDITANAGETVDFMREYWSLGTDKLYFLPVQVGPDSAPQSHLMGAVLRWDLFKEAGAPETESMDEYLQVIKQMVDLHPTTENGQQVYGVSFFTDWGNWCLTYATAAWLGIYNNVDVTTNEWVDTYLDTNNCYWKSIEYYYKANQLGILDPDAFTQKYADFTAKCGSGQVITSLANWACGSYNRDHADGVEGFVAIPVKWGNQWNGAFFKAGWMDKSYGITTNCKYPEKAMDFINYTFSYDGARTLYSGVEGIDWNYVDGVATLTDDVIALKSAGGEEWAKYGLEFDENFMGQGLYCMHPDGKPLDLFNDSALYADVLSVTEKDMAEHYGVAYPTQAFEQYREKYGVVDQANFDTFMYSLVPTKDDDIARIETNLEDIITKMSTKLILAADDAEFEALKADTIEQLKRAGADEYHAYFAGVYADARAKSLALSGN